MNDTHRELTPEEHFEFILALIDDETLQNKSVNEFLALQMSMGSDSNSNLTIDSSFGWEPENPIPVNGPFGERTYLSRLRTKSGIPFFFHRLGSTHGTVDIFELVAFDGSEQATLYLDMYHMQRCHSSPIGLDIAEDITPFTGMTLMVDNFPAGLIQALRPLRGTTNGDCYLPEEFMKAALKNAGWL